MANRIVFMDAGQIIESNTPANFFANPQHARTKLFLSQILRESRASSSLRKRGPMTTEVVCCVSRLPPALNRATTAYGSLLSQGRRRNNHTFSERHLDLRPFLQPRRHRQVLRTQEFWIEQL